ncbi:nitroreductase family protein [Gordonia sp. ABSL11-1]|uniref:nitroreductase family protein n=1 Tax=Gordonia sp. ABSL11-1 TaxID=3053924 RepID=UPI002572D5F1|nr:nitroreductase family protein [Gordonia sp. ABSL11-1]MDL9944955.1 nitroreductase family protein [Gordonia sp. ABSL11-1]
MTLSPTEPEYAVTADLLRRRYRDPDLTALRLRSPVIDQLLAHRSVRQFLDAPVDDDQLTSIIAAAQSASTSSNLQAWSVIAVRDPARRARLAALAGDQQFLRCAPLVLVWLADLGRAARVADRHGAALDATDYLESTVLGFVDASLAAQNAVVAAESLGLGAVFVGAFRNRPTEVAAELRLPQRVFATFGLAVGVPDPEERAGIKPRLPQRVVVHQETYDPSRDEAVADYDSRLAAYNREYERDAGWIAPLLSRLADRHSLKGRDDLRARLRDQGLPSR